MTRNFAIELGPSNITCNTVAPGFFPSKLANGLIEILGGQKELEDENPRKRLGVPEDIAGVMVYLASPAAAYVYVPYPLPAAVVILLTSMQKWRRYFSRRWPTLGSWTTLQVVVLAMLFAHVPLLFIHELLYDKPSCYRDQGNVRPLFCSSSCVAFARSRAVFDHL